MTVKEQVEVNIRLSVKLSMIAGSAKSAISGSGLSRSKVLLIRAIEYRRKIQTII